MSVFEIIKGAMKKGITPKEQEIMKQNQAGRNQEQVYVKMNELDSGNGNSSNWNKNTFRRQDKLWTQCTQESTVIWEITLGSSLLMLQGDKEIENRKENLRDMEDRLRVFTWTSRNRELKE